MTNRGRATAKAKAKTKTKANAKAKAKAKAKRNAGVSPLRCASVEMTDLSEGIGEGAALGSDGRDDGFIGGVSERGWFGAILYNESVEERCLRLS
jgi:hypothetical protein